MMAVGTSGGSVFLISPDTMTVYAKLRWVRLGGWVQLGAVGWLGVGGHNWVVGYRWVAGCLLWVCGRRLGSYAPVRLAA